jgi:hypothetical protein
LVLHGLTLLLPTICALKLLIVVKLDHGIHRLGPGLVNRWPLLLMRLYYVANILKDHSTGKLNYF